MKELAIRTRARICFCVILVALAACVALFVISAHEDAKEITRIVCGYFALAFLLLSFFGAAMTKKMLREAGEAFDLGAGELASACFILAGADLFFGILALKNGACQEGFARAGIIDVATLALALSVTAIFAGIITLVKNTEKRSSG